MTSIRPDGRIQFQFYRPGASDVRVVGTFNKWDGRFAEMQPIGDGWFIAELEIEAGEHSFRYVADGHWYTDFAANGVEKNKYGWNSILIVPATRMRLVPADTDFDSDNQIQTLAA